MDWAGFAAWLAADPRHRACYDDIARLDDALVRHRTVLLALTSRQPRARAWWRWAGPGLAAMAAALAVGYFAIPQEPTRVMRSATAVGERRTIALTDRVVVTLDPGGVLIAGAQPRDPLTLSGRAYFTVRHDPAHPLVIRASGFEIRDVGTRFEVTTAKGSLRVAVAQGRVDLSGAGLPGDVPLEAGRVLTAIGPSGMVETRRVDVATIAAQARNHLSYHDVPLAFVVADISRLVGAPVDIDPITARRRFSGALAFGTREKMVDALKELMDLDARSDGSAIHLSSLHPGGD